MSNRSKFLKSKKYSSNFKLYPFKERDNVEDGPSASNCHAVVSKPIENRPSSGVSLKRLNKVGPLVKPDIRRRSGKTIESAVNLESTDCDVVSERDEAPIYVHDLKRQQKRQMIYSFLNAYFNFPLIFLWLPAVMLCLISGYALHLRLFHMAHSDTRRAKKLNVACLITGIVMYTGIGLALFTGTLSSQSATGSIESATSSVPVMKREVITRAEFNDLVTLTVNKRGILEGTSVDTTVLDNAVIAFFNGEGATNVSIVWKQDSVTTTLYKMSAVALFVSDLGAVGIGEDLLNSTGFRVIQQVKEAFVSKALSGSLLGTVSIDGVTVTPAKSIESIQTAFTVEEANPTTPAPVFKNIKVTKVKFKNLAKLRSKKHKKNIQTSEVVSNPFIETRDLRVILDGIINTTETDNQVIGFFLDQGAENVIIEWQRDRTSNSLYNMNALTKFVNDVDEGDGTGSSGTGVGSSVIDTAFIASMAGAFVNVTTSGNLTLATPEGAEEIVPIDSVKSIETSTEVSIVQVIVTTTTTTTTTTPFEYEYGYSIDRVLTKHENYVFAVAIHPQGTLLASSSYTTFIWDPKTGNDLRAFSSHSIYKWTYAVAFSPSNVLATGSQDSTIKLWNSDTGGLYRTLTGHTGAVYGLAFSSANLLASCSADTQVKVWNPDNGTCLRTLTLHSNPVYSVAFSLTNPSLLASASYSTMIWNVDTGVKLFTLIGHAANMMTFSCAFSPSNVLATASEDLTVKLWNPDTGTLIRTLTGHTNVIYGVAFSPSGLMATGAADRSVKLWNPETGVCLRTLTEHTAHVRGLAFSSTGVLVSCSSDTNVMMWIL